ncbi:hypothetical protein V2J09_009943 [Rumex salicifolius]
MQTRYMERSNSMTRGKRPLDSSEAEDHAQPDRKRPALASVIVEALKLDSLQKLCSSLEPVLRRVVSEEVERALARLGSGKFVGRASPQRIEGPDGRNLQLYFRTRLSLPLFTGGKVEGEQGAAIHIVLVDAITGQVVTSGPESCAKLDVVVLEGDFNYEDDESWSQDDFESQLVKEREGKGALLNGELQVQLKEGVGTLGELSFTDNSSWIRSRKFRLGLKVASGYCEGIRIREGKTEAFTVKDHRGELYKKHYPPALSDEVWRLEKIGKDGSFHKRLNKAGIQSVEDFLRFVVRDPQKLRNILGSGMSNKMWDALIEHAKTCVLGGKLYIYYPDDGQGVGVIFNNIYEFSGLIAGGQYYSSETLSDSQKVYADTLVKKAYDNWMHVVEYDSKALLGLKQHRNGIGGVSQRNLNSYGQQLSLPSLPVAASFQQPPMDSSLKIGGYNGNGNTSTKLPIPPQTMNLNGSIQFSSSSLPENQLNGSSHQSSHQTEVVRNNNSAFSLTPPQTSLAYQPIATPDYNQFRGIEDFVSEEEIRLRSHEMLQHEDMQHLLRMFSMGTQTPAAANLTNGYAYPSPYIPSPSLNYSLDEDRSRTSGKAVVGWLKLKAALRWGIFIRKKAAERRAQLVELEDT